MLQRRNVRRRLSAGRATVDFVLLCCMGVPLLVCELAVHPYKRGLYCDDESLRYPYRQETINKFLLMSVGVIVPVLTVSRTPSPPLPPSSSHETRDPSRHLRFVVPV